MKIYCKKLSHGLSPDTISDIDALSKIKTGDIVSVEIKRPRNYEFHKKLWALFQHAYDCWEPVEILHNGEPIQKNFDRFRKELIILAGFYTPVYSVKGEMRAEPHSISFANMTQDEFETLYSKIIDVVLQRILNNYTRDDLEKVVEETLRFA